MATGHQGGHYLALAAHHAVALCRAVAAVAQEAAQAPQGVQGLCGGRRVRGRGTGHQVRAQGRAQVGGGGRRRRLERPDIGGGHGTFERGRFAQPLIALHAAAVPNVDQIVEAAAAAAGRTGRRARARASGREGTRAAGRAGQACERRDPAVGAGVVHEAAEAVQIGGLQGVEQVVQAWGGVQGRQHICRVLKEFCAHGARSTGTHCDMGLDLPPGRVHGLGQPGHFKDGLLVPGWSHDVRGGLVLDALDRGALGADHQADDAVGDAHLDGHLAGDVRRRARGRQRPGRPAQTRQVVLARSANLREMLGGRQDLTLGLGDVLLPAGHDEHGLLAAHRRLDVRVGLGAQGLDLAALSTNNFGDVL